MLFPKHEVGNSAKRKTCAFWTVAKERLLPSAIPSRRAESRNKHNGLDKRERAVPRTQGIRTSLGYCYFGSRLHEQTRFHALLGVRVLKRSGAEHGHARAPHAVLRDFAHAMTNRAHGQFAIQSVM